MAGVFIGLGIVLLACLAEDAKWRGELYDDDDEITEKIKEEKSKKEKKKREIEPYDEESDPFRQLIT